MLSSFETPASRAPQDEGRWMPAHPRKLRKETHSSDGGRKAYLNFELKDGAKRRRLRRSRSLTSKFR